MSTVAATNSDLKTCTVCQEEKERTEFYGRHARCKDCWNAIRRERAKSDPRVKEWSHASYMKHRDKRRANAKIKREENKEAIAAYRAALYQRKKPEYAAKRKARYQADSLKVRLQVADYRRRNPEKVKAAQDRWRKTEYGRERMKILTLRRRTGASVVYKISDKDMQRLLSSPCVECGHPKSTLDHIIPIKRGGTHGVGNLQPLCGKCNSSKGAKLMVEWRRDRALGIGRVA